MEALLSVLLEWGFTGLLLAAFTESFISLIVILVASIIAYAMKRSKKAAPAVNKL